MPRFSYTADDLLKLARERAGLTDFGDERFMPAFRMMVHGLTVDMPVTPAGEELARERFLRLLVNRLRANADFEAHPEIFEEEIAAPLIVLGLPRTGSTKLHRMMGAADSVRSLLMWQGYNPAPFPGGASGEDDPRIEDAARFLAWRASRNASINKAHHAEAKEPEEELYLIELSFANWASVGYYFSPTYLSWLRGQDRDYVYDYMRQMLQYVQWQHHRGAPPKRWILKSPPNLGLEASMLKAFPDARFVMLHRDLMSVIPSWISLTQSMLHQYAETQPGKPEVAQAMMAEAEDMLAKQAAWRASLAKPPILDVAYDEVMRDEMAVIRRVYDFAGMELTPAAEQAMRAWAEANGQHRHGEHVYSLDGSGMTEADILGRLKSYAERYSAYMNTAALA